MKNAHVSRYWEDRKYSQPMIRDNRLNIYYNNDIISKIHCNEMAHTQ